MNDDDPYCYPGTDVLRNRLGITDPAQLDKAERRLVVQRTAAGIPKGRFDLAHLRTIHRHLFQDVYEWAGELRTVEIAKGGSQFQFRRFIEAGMADVHARLVQARHLRGLRAPDFATAAGVIIGDVNHVHPFRDGNGRTQLQYLAQLGEMAGHPVVLRNLDPRKWIEASKRAQAADYALMGETIGEALAPPRRRARSRDKDRGWER